MRSKKVTDNEKKQMIGMRNEGSSIGEIASTFARSRSTVVRYVKDVAVLPEFRRAWEAKRGGSANRAEKRRDEANSRAKALLAGANTRDRLTIAACLYWGEGDKREFGLSNTDPKLIETFLNCLTGLGLKKERLKISVRLYEDIDKDKAIRFWAQIVDINPDDILSVDIISGKKRGKLSYGMCRIRLTKGNDYFNLMMATVKLISKNFAPIAQRIRATDS